MAHTESETRAPSDPFARTAKTRGVGLALAMFVAPWFIVLFERSRRSCSHTVRTTTANCSSVASRGPLTTPLRASHRPYPPRRAPRHCLGDWFQSTDELIGRIRNSWVGGRPMVPTALPLNNRVPRHDNAYVATAHGLLGVTLAPTTAAALVEYIATERRPPVLRPFSFDPIRRLES